LYIAVLVDDEPLVLRGLLNHPVWEQLDIHIAGSFNSGLQALEFVKAHHVDILLTDIRMPLMSGLELARQCRLWNDGLKIVIISGYEDFSYAKQAMALHVKDYLLKPVDDHELMNTMQSISEQLDEERATKRMKSSYMEWFSLAKNEMIRQWIVNNQLSAELLHLLHAQPLAMPEEDLCVGILEMDDLALKRNLTAIEQQADLTKEVFGEMMGFFQEHNLHYFSRLNEQQVAVVLDNKEAIQHVQSLVEQIRRKTVFTITVGVGNPVQTIDHLSRSYTEALGCLQAKIYLGKGQVITPPQVKQEMLSSTEDLDELIVKLLNHVSEYEVLGIYDGIKEFVTCAASLQAYAIPRNIALYLIAKLDGFLNEMNVKLFQIPQIELNQLELLLHFETLNDVERWLRNNLFHISEYLNVNKIRKKRRLVQEIEEYIVRHLGDEVTLKKVAAHFSFTPNYVGHIFKEETGDNFSEYVTRMRLAKTAVLLRENPGMKIYEAAYANGFNHLPYFTKLFKEQFGMSPSEYRSRP
jgi:two-component system, response regulator YesN